jgi:hypothetical protein
MSQRASISEKNVGEEFFLTAAQVIRLRGKWSECGRDVTSNSKTLYLYTYTLLLYTTLSSWSLVLRVNLTSQS